MLIRRVSGSDIEEIGVTGQESVLGEDLDVDDELAASLCAQTDKWQVVKPSKAAKPETEEE
jgi:hypothetical protein